MAASLGTRSGSSARYQVWPGFRPLQFHPPSGAGVRLILQCSDGLPIPKPASRNPTISDPTHLGDLLSKASSAATGPWSAPAMPQSRQGQSQDRMFRSDLPSPFGRRSGASPTAVRQAGSAEIPARTTPAHAPPSDTQSVPRISFCIPACSASARLAIVFQFTDGSL